MTRYVYLRIRDTNIGRMNVLPAQADKSQQFEKFRRIHPFAIDIVSEGTGGVNGKGMDIRFACSVYKWMCAIAIRDR